MGFCSHPAKVMNGLACGTSLSAYCRATSQPKPRSLRFARRVISLHSLDTKQLFPKRHPGIGITDVAWGWLLGAISSLTLKLFSPQVAASDLHFPQREVSAAQHLAFAPAPRSIAYLVSGAGIGQLSDCRTHLLGGVDSRASRTLADRDQHALEPGRSSPTNSSSESFPSSANSLSDDPSLCLVCNEVTCRSCPVCDQDFCSNHLYSCDDCDNQYCGHCLDEHRSDGHWTDSDTALELGFTQRLSGGEIAHQSNSADASLFACNQATRRSGGPSTLTRFNSLIAFLVRSACRALLNCPASSQSIQCSEVC